MPDPDISVIVTAHSEGIMLGATMRSVAIAVSAAEQAGFRCECLAGLDSPTDATRTIFKHKDLSHWTVREVEFRDPFLARNAMIEAATGRWIALVDGDDLISENWLERAAERLQVSSDKSVAHPEFNVIFDEQTTSFRKIECGDSLFLPEVFYFENYYDLMALASRSTYLKHPFSPREIDAGYGYQDWQWNMKTLAAGIEHLVVEDTIIFKRRRRNSVSQDNRARSAVVRFVPEAMRIDAIRHLGSIARD